MSIRELVLAMYPPTQPKALPGKREPHYISNSFKMYTARCCRASTHLLFSLPSFFEPRLTEVKGCPPVFMRELKKDYVRILPKVTWPSSESRSPEQAGSLVTGPSVPRDQAAASPPTLLFSPASPTQASYYASQQSSISPLLHSMPSGMGFELQAHNTL